MSTLLRVNRHFATFQRPIKLMLSLLLLSQLSACALALVGAAGGAAMVANDRRLAEVILDDQRIEVKATDLIYNDPQMAKKIHANVTSYNYTVLLTGEVVSEQLKQRVVELVSHIDKVKLVHNELVVANLANFSERSGDTWLTSKVKTRMLAAKAINGSHIKVVSENSTVYLLGLVTQDEASSAAKIASETKGVEKVVTMFEYIDPSQIPPQAPVEAPKLQKI